MLQVRRDASVEVIAAAYRRLMRDAHPDHGGDLERAKRLNRAYETLSSPGARSAYDRTLPPESADGRPLGLQVAYRLGVGIGRWMRKARHGAA